MTTKPKIIALLGPTAVGKTALAVHLANRLNGEIVSTDSRLFYRGMDIGTAKPSMAERQGVPHHLIDIRNPDETYSLASFLDDAYPLIDEIVESKKTAILAGGSGQYLRSLTEGWLIPKQEPDPILRELIEAWGQQVGPAELHRRLAIVDPQAGQTIEPLNLRRTVRAIEVIFRTGIRFSEQRRKSEPRYEVIQAGLIRERPALYERIDQRIDQMITGGLVAEVKGLLGQGYSENLPAFTAIGYQETVRHLNEEISLDEAITLMKRRTRTLVRRQSNWFRREDEGIKWFDLDITPIDKILDWISAKL